MCIFIDDIDPNRNLVIREREEKCLHTHTIWVAILPPVETPTGGNSIEMQTNAIL